eukprot:3170702-Amphidinium_carterae.1
MLLALDHCSLRCMDTMQRDEIVGTDEGFYISDVPGVIIKVGDWEPRLSNRILEAQCEDTCTNADALFSSNEACFTQCSRIEVPWSWYGSWLGFGDRHAWASAVNEALYNTTATRQMLQAMVVPGAFLILIVAMALVEA